MPPRRPADLPTAVYSAIGDIPPACMAEIKQLYPALDTKVLADAFRQLGQRRPERAIGKVTNTPARLEAPLADPLVINGKSSEHLRELLRDRTPSQTLKGIGALQSHSFELFKALKMLRPDVRAIIEDPYKSSLGIGDLDRLADTLRTFQFALKALLDARSGGDGREGINPTTGLIWTVANLVHQAGLDADGSPEGAVCDIVARVLARSDFLKNVPSSVQKAMKNWPRAVQA